MDSLFIMFVAGFVMSLFLIPVVMIVTFLEVNHREKEFLKYARKKVMKQLEHEKYIEEKLNKLIH